LESPGLSLKIGKLGTVNLPAGILAYVGSARGPGGLGMRIKRHFSKGKTLRWHVDYLTEELGVPCSLAFPEGDESSLSRILKVIGRPLVRGFGCSDKKEDYTHLYFLDEDLYRALMSLFEIFKEERACLVWNPYRSSRSFGVM